VYNRDPDKQTRLSIVVEVKASDEDTPWTAGCYPSDSQMERAAQVISYAHYMASVNKSSSAAVLYWCPVRVCFLLLGKDDDTADSWASFKVKSILKFDLRVGPTLTEVQKIIRGLCGANGRTDDIRRVSNNAGARQFSCNTLMVNDHGY